MPTRPTPVPMNRLRLSALALAAHAILLAGTVNARADETVATPDTWVEEPRLPGVDHDTAEHLAALTALGGSGVLGAWLVLGYAAWDLPLSVVGGVSSAWAAHQSPTPVRQAMERGTTTAVVTHLGQAAVATLAVPTSLGLGLLLGTLAGGATALTASQLHASAPSTAAAVLLLGAGVTLTSTVLLLAFSSTLGALLQQAVFTTAWNAFPSSLDEKPHAATPARPLDAANTTLLLRTVARGSLRQSAWREGVPVLGPLWHAWTLRRTVAHDVDRARLLAGMPRIKDTLQQDVDLMLWGRAALLTAAWLSVPLVGMGLTGAGAAWLVPEGSAPAVVAASVAGLAVAGVAVAAGLMLWTGAGVVGALTPWWLARAAAPVDTDPQVDERLKLPPRRVIAPPVCPGPAACS